MILGGQDELAEIHTRENCTLAYENLNKTQLLIVLEESNKRREKNKYEEQT